MNNPLKQPFTFDRVVRLLIGAGVAVALYFLFNKLSGVLLPFLCAWLLAYIMYPIVCFFQYRCRLRSRIAAIAVMLLLLGGVVFGLLWFVAPPVFHEIGRTATLIQQSIAEMETAAFLPEKLRLLLVEWYENFELESLFTADNFKEFEKYAPHVWQVVSGSLNFVVSQFAVFVVFLYVVFILLDYETIASGWITLIPQKYRATVTHIFDDVKSGMNRYFRGQSLIALISGTLLAIGFSIINLPLGVLLGAFMGVLTLVPYMKLAMLPALAFFALLQSMETGANYWFVLLSVLIVMVVVQVFEDLFLVPKIMGKAMQMNPAVILLSLSVWGVLLGVAGMIIALPITTILVSYYRRIVIDGSSIADNGDAKNPSEEQ